MCSGAAQGSVMLELQEGACASMGLRRCRPCLLRSGLSKVSQQLCFISSIESQVHLPLLPLFRPNQTKRPTNSHRSIKIGCRPCRRRSDVTSYTLGRGCPSTRLRKRQRSSVNRVLVHRGLAVVLPWLCLRLASCRRDSEDSAALSVTRAERRLLKKCRLGQGRVEPRTQAPRRRALALTVCALASPLTPSSSPESVAGKRVPCLGSRLCLPPLCLVSGPPLRRCL